MFDRGHVLIESPTQYAVNRRSATAINRYSTQILEVLPIINYCRTSNSYKTIQYQKQYRYQNQYLESIICTAGMNDIEPPTAECTGTGVAERELHHSHACVWCHCHWAPVQARMLPVQALELSKLEPQFRNKKKERDDDSRTKQNINVQPGLSPEA